jgi:ubiquinone/menaquinone biosynthesis C-methylase UbiE
MEKLIRSFVPSTASLTYKPWFKVGSRVCDILPQLIFRELRNLPPNYMRIRIGAGNRLFANHLVYLMAARNFWYYMFGHGIVSPRSTIVDIGSGCGRYAHHMRDYEFKDERFSGRYYGIDIDQEMLDWCRRHFDAPRFTFVHSSHTSKTYENAAPGSQTFRLPIDDNNADLVFSTSLYTHLLEAEIDNYTREAARVLKPGGYMAMYVFSMTNPPPTYGTRHTFKHRIGPAYVESLANPEAAVAYEDPYLINLAKQAGFADACVVTVPGEAQPMLLARKTQSIELKKAA